MRCDHQIICGLLRRCKCKLQISSISITPLSSFQPQYIFLDVIVYLRAIYITAVIKHRIELLVWASIVRSSYVCFTGKKRTSSTVGSPWSFADTTLIVNIEHCPYYRALNTITTRSASEYAHKISHNVLQAHLRTLCRSRDHVYASIRVSRTTKMGNPAAAPNDEAARAEVPIRCKSP